MSRIAAIVATVLTATVVLSSLAHGGPAVPPVAKPQTGLQTPAGGPRSVPGRPARPSPASFTPEMSFAEAIDILRHATTPPLNIVVLWKEIGENAGVYKETPIGIDGLVGVRLRHCMEILLTSVSAGAATKLGYVVQGGVVTIATVDSLPVPRKVTRVYDVSDLLSEPARYFVPPIGFGAMGMGAYGGGPMMGPSGYGGYGGYGSGYGPGGPYTSGGYYGGGGLSGLVGGLYGGNGRLSTTYGRR